MFSAKTKLAFALTTIVVSVVLLAKQLGLVPKTSATVIQGRGQLCESVAMTSAALLSKSDVRTLETFLDALVRRNPDLRAAGYRMRHGRLLVSTDQHQEVWQLPEGDPSNDQFMFVPLLGRSGIPGRLELCFSPIQRSQLASLLDPDAGELLLFVGPCCFLIFSFLLGLMVKQLDPTGSAIPSRVADAFDNLAEGLLVIDTKDRILHANQAFVDVVGMPTKKLLGKRAAQLGWLNENVRVSSDLPWQRALREERPLSNLALQLESPDGEKKSFVVNASPVVAGHEGKFRGVLVTFDDVTVLEKQKAALGEAQLAAEAANRAKSEFLANMSHEIRTPMNAILGFTDVLRRGMESDEEKRTRYLDTIHSSGTHLIELINDILDLSKIEAGKLELEITDESPYRIMDEVAEILVVRAEQKNITLNTHVEGRIPATIKTDPTKLRQILTNLVGNAIKFTQAGGVIVTCRLDGEMVAFDIADTGIGMTKQQLSRIFNPFEQADTSVTRRFGGTGLGLSISKRFAEALGGEIRVQSQPGKGTVFTVRVDTGSLDGVAMLDAGQSRRRVEQQRKQSREATNVRIRQGAVLVVDDGESNREFLNIVLTQLGLDVSEAENGQVAVDMATSMDFDIILMDMQMPVMDGYTATRTLRQRGLTIPIFALTANAMQGDEKKCEEAGCDGHLGKPIDLDRLTGLLRDELGEKELGEEDAATVDVPPEVTADGQTTGVTRSTIDRSRVFSPDADSELIYSPLADNPTFAPIIVKFVDRLPERLIDMCDAWDQRDYEELARHAHWLKGSAGTVGFHILTEPSGTLESLARNQDDDGLEDALERIIDIVVRIQPHECPTPPKSPREPSQSKPETANT